MIGMPQMGGVTGATGANTGAVTGGGVGAGAGGAGAVSPGAVGAGQQGQTAGVGRAQPQQMFFRASMPKGFSMQPGQSMWGQVTGRQGRFFTLQFGKFALKARTHLPLSVGQQIHVAYTGKAQGSQIGLQLLQTATFSKMSQADLSQALTQMNMPVNEQTMAVAKGLVEFKIPLTPKNVADFSRVLSQLGRPATTTDMAAASFLKMANVPMTPSNVNTLSNFIARHPLLGAQMFELQKGPGSVAKAKREGFNREIEILEELSKTTNRYVVDPAKQNPQSQARNLRNLAREEGVERLRHGFGGANMEEGWELMSLLREMEGIPGKSGGENMEKAADLLRTIQQNLAAHHIINNGRPLPEMAFFYLQVPLKLDHEETTAELRIRYYEEEESKVVDPENTHIEFDVSTENLGDVHIDLKVHNGVVDLDVGVEEDGLREFVEGFGPVLTKNLTDLGYLTRSVQARYFEGGGSPPLVEKEDFETLERIDVQT